MLALVYVILALFHIILVRAYVILVLFYVIVALVYVILALFDDMLTKLDSHDGSFNSVHEPQCMEWFIQKYVHDMFFLLCLDMFCRIWHVLVISFARFLHYLFVDSFCSSAIFCILLCCGHLGLIRVPWHYCSICVSSMFMLCVRCWWWLRNTHACVVVSKTCPI